MVFLGGWPKKFSWERAVDILVILQYFLQLVHLSRQAENRLFRHELFSEVHVIFNAIQSWNVDANLWNVGKGTIATISILTIDTDGKMSFRGSLVPPPVVPRAPMWENLRLH